MSRLTSLYAALGIVCLLALGNGCAKRAAKDAPPPGGIEGGPPVTLVVVISGVEHTGGVMRLALFDSPDGFPGTMDAVYRRLEAPIEGAEVVFTIAEVPAGRYAVSVYHDENGNDSMETDMFGRPSEGYGFSNDARGRFGPPGFDDAAFVVLDDPTEIRIVLDY
jgi:uncharacterized protein (DUF2141 family)